MPTLPAIPAGVPSHLLAAAARHRGRRAHHEGAERRDRRRGRGLLPDHLAVGRGGLHAVALERLAALGQPRLVARRRTAPRRCSTSASGTPKCRRRGPPTRRPSRAIATPCSPRSRTSRTICRACASSPSRPRRSTPPCSDAVRGTEIAMAEFKAGTVDYTTVAQAQETQLDRPAKRAHRAAEPPARRGFPDRRSGRRLVRE